jgi:hypothetical protein
MSVDHAPALEKLPPAHIAETATSPREQLLGAPEGSATVRPYAASIAVLSRSGSSRRAAAAWRAAVPLHRAG